MLTIRADSVQKPIYLDCHSTTPVDPRVLEAMLPFLQEDFGNPHSSEHHLGRRALCAVDAARARLADCVDVDPIDLVFTSGATESNNLAILGYEPPQGRDTILVSAIEHASVLAAAYAREHHGYRVTEIPVDRHGFVDLDVLRNLLTDRVFLVSVGAVNNEIGCVQDIVRIGELAHCVGAAFHTDAAQALTAMPLTLSEWPVDLVSLSSHKCYGPKGIGALYISPAVRSLIRPLIHGGGQEHGLRAGTLPTALCVGFGVAAQCVKKAGERERQEVERKRNALRSALSQRILDLEIIGPETQRHPGNLSVRFNIGDARDMVELVQPDLACSTGSACRSGEERPSHVLTAIGLSIADARRVVRFGIGRFTSDQEVLAAVDIVGRAFTQCSSIAAH